MSRRLGYKLAGLLLLISLVAYWEGATPHVSLVRYSTPQGFCQLDKTDKVDTEYLDAMANYARTGGFSVVAAYADCGELALARKSGAFIQTKIAILRWLRVADKPSPQFISEACDTIRKSGLSDDQKTLMSRYVTEFSDGRNSLKSVLPLGVIDEVKGTVCYGASLMRANIVSHDDVTLLDLSAMTTVGNQPFAIHQWTRYRDANSVATALANLKTAYSDFAALNGKGD